MDTAQVRAALDEADELPYGRERTARREDLVVHAEQCGDPATSASALLSLADDCQETGDNQGMVVSFGRAWRIWQHRPEVFDAYLRFRFREHFQHVIDVLDEDERVPEADVDRLMDEMDAFYRAGGYSMRAVYRSRYWIHRRRGQDDDATKQVEALLAEDGDSGASCDACDLATAAYWYEKLDDLPRAVELWRAILSGVRSCNVKHHVSVAHGEVMIDLLNLGRFDEARTHHEAGYPMIRRNRGLPRQLELHALYVNRTRSLLRGLEILHDHVDWLPQSPDDVGGLWWVCGRFLLFLNLLKKAGLADLPVTRPGGQVVPAVALHAELDAVLGQYAARKDAEASGTDFTETLETWRGGKIRHDRLPPRSAAATDIATTDITTNSATTTDPDPAIATAIATDADLEAGRPPIPAPWADGPDAGPARPLPDGFEPVDMLAAEARYLKYLSHPHAFAAWERVAACVPPSADTERPDPDREPSLLEAELAEHRVWVAAARRDWTAAAHWISRAMSLYVDLDRFDHALRTWAQTITLMNQEDADEEAAEAQHRKAREQAAAAFAAGRIDGAQRVRIHLPGLLLRLDRWRRVIDAEPDVDPELSKRVAQEGSSDDAEFGELATEHSALPEYGVGVRAWTEVTAALRRMFHRDGDTEQEAAYEEKVADRLGDVVGLFDSLHLPWLAAEAELARGRALLTAGRAHDDAERLRAAEDSAREVMARNDPPVAAQLEGPAMLLLAEAIAAQDQQTPGEGPERTGEAVAAAVEAAQLLAGADRAGAARARLLVAEAHYRAGRHEAADHLFGPALDEIVELWEDEDCRLAIYTGVRHHAECLRALDRPRDAVELLDLTLSRVSKSYPTARSFMWYELAFSYEDCGQLENAVHCFVLAAESSREAGNADPRVIALKHAARVVAPTDIEAAFRHLDQSEAAAGEITEPELARRVRYLMAEARSLKLKYLVARVEAETVSEEHVDALMPSARAAAESALAELRELLETPDPTDAREDYVTAMERVLKPLTLVQMVIDADPAAAARAQSAFAADCERWGFAQFAEVAANNARYAEEQAG
ncbi:MAG TPA: hypothetical protein VFU73_10080 [Actinocrinis sp.]|nr:hypothetical protein [Actinocrinis sp.]